MIRLEGFIIVVYFWCVWFEPERWFWGATAMFIAALLSGIGRMLDD